MLKINILKKIFGSDNEREISRIKKIVDEINQLEERYSKEDTSELKKIFLKLKNNESNNQNLDLLIPDVFAIVREISKRKLGLRPYDVQLIGGVVLHEGKIAEMKTGEGKTLVACLPVILNSIKGEGVHLVTVNDYLARRDALWMSPIYMALGLTVGISNNDKSYIVESKDDNEFSLMESKRQEI
ncbi:MAG TPA: preprotein translocase subunit SecA, partial [Candidatus Dadabacteria bacterium]|nr:preprotein translocase subunit SecA [Candidatus Dadabacteria bacterium]